MLASSYRAVLLAALGTLALGLTGCPPSESDCGGSCIGGIQACCDGVCIGVLNDPNNCGGCGVSCFGRACSGGTCFMGDAGGPDAPRDGGPPAVCPGGAGTRMCPAGVVNCSGWTGGVHADGSGDITFSNCGVCGFMCNTDHHNRCATVGGGLGTPSCFCGTTNTCNDDMDACEVVGGMYTCIHLGNDEMNCGTVGNACASSEMCVEGECVCNPTTMETCEAGEACCGSTCVDVTADEANCGACGTACLAGEMCVTETGGPSECLCGTDTCDAAETCVDDVCVCNPTTMSVCGAGEGCCAMNCIDIATDNSNCGGCGIVCGAMTSCADVGGVIGCYCGTDVCDPVATTVGAPAGELCCDDGTGTGTNHCVPQDAANCRECGRMCDGTSDTCNIANPAPGDTGGPRPCCSGDIIPIFGFCSDDFGG